MASVSFLLKTLKIKKITWPQKKDADNSKIMVYLHFKIRDLPVKFRWEVLEYLQHSLGISPCNSHVFDPLKELLEDQRFTYDKDVQDTVENWISSATPEFLYWSHLLPSYTLDSMHSWQLYLVGLLDMNCNYNILQLNYFEMKHALNIKVFFFFSFERPFCNRLIKIMQLLLLTRNRREIKTSSNKQL